MKNVILPPTEAPKIFIIEIEGRKAILRTAEDAAQTIDYKKFEELLKTAKKLK